MEKIELTGLPEHAPTLYEQLRSDADEEQGTPEQFLDGYKGGLAGYVNELLEWCQTELRQAEKRPRIQALASQVRARQLILSREALEVLSRYQTTLDNQLFKALRALRETQEWRLKTLNGSAEENTGLQEKAA